MATARRRPRALGQLLAQGGRNRARQVLILVLLVAQVLSTQKSAPTCSQLGAHCCNPHHIQRCLNGYGQLIHIAQLLVQ